MTKTNKNQPDRGYRTEYREDVYKSLVDRLGKRNPFIDDEDLKFTAHLIRTPANVERYVTIYNHFEEKAGLKGKSPPKNPDRASERTALDWSMVHTTANLYWVIHYTKGKISWQYR
jgi:hypothetical protein